MTDAPKNGRFKKLFLIVLLVVGVVLIVESGWRVVQEREYTAGMQRLEAQYAAVQRLELQVGVKLYENARQGGSAKDAYVRAGAVAELYRLAKDSDSARKWDEITRQEAGRAGVTR